MHTFIFFVYFCTMQRHNELIYHIVALVTVAIWGSTFISTKMLIMNGLSPAQIFTLRFLMAYVLLLLVSHNRWHADSIRDELIMAALGVTGGSAYFLTENYALVYSTATNVSLIVCSCPLFATLLFFLFFKTVKLTARQWTGALLAFLGMIAVVLNGQFVLHLSPLGDSLAFAACMCWVAYSLLMKLVTSHYSSAFITRKVFFYGLITMIPYYLIIPTFPTTDQLLRPQVLYNLLFLGCVASMLCFLTWTWVMGKMGAMRATNYVYVNPITTIIFAAWILGEKITPYFLLGTACILAGLYLSNHKQEYS